MAEALLRKLAGDRFEVYSAGYEPQGINPLTMKVMEEIGIDLNQQRSKSVDEFLGRISFQYLITVCHKAETDCPTTFPGVMQRYFWPFEDPAACIGSEDTKLTKFRDIRDQIEKRLKLWLREVD